MPTTRAGNYDLIAEIGPAALGTVYAARHVFFDTDVRLTLLPSRVARDATRVAALAVTARCAHALHHDHLLPLIEVGREGRLLFVVEDAVDAPDLASWVRTEAPRSLADVLVIATQVGQALAAIHGRDLVHGGVHPGAVFVVRRDPLRVVLAGLAVGPAWAPAGCAPAVEPFLAPELKAIDVGRRGRFDPRVDVFGLASLVQFLVGRILVADTDWRPSATTRQLALAVPAALEDLLLRATDPRPEHRPRDMTVFLQELAAASGETTDAPDTVVVPASVRTSEPPPLRLLRPVAAERRERPAPSSSRATRRLIATSAVAASIAAVMVARRPVDVVLPVVVPNVAHDGAAVPAPSVVPVSSPTPPASWVQDGDGESVRLLAVSRQEGDTPTGEAAARDGDGAERWEPRSAPEAPPERQAMRPRVNHPPRILQQMPDGHQVLRVAEGDSVALAVRVADPDPDDRLGHRWLLDGKVVGWGPAWRFVAPPQAGSVHAVEVQVVDRVGERVPAHWRIEVTPRMHEVDAREWLERLRSAWERKDIATLRLYGVVSSDAQAAALRKMLGSFEEYHVAFHDPRVEVAGAYATVHFKRTDTDGKEPIGFAQQTYELEKRPSGLITLRATTPTM
ncbi:MAG: hypothetical protein U0807_16230 [Candidatus Binatia bacterium]